MQDKLQYLESEVSGISAYVYVDGKATNKGVEIFKPNDNGVATLTTLEGDNFLVRLAEINKYANGYKVTFYIGNPNYATYSGSEGLC
ncbi:MAG: hypothetical protein U5L76_02395 [Patescibacteria group bacterium]|nr:hypothetical protein [Patescibacteria group bacterium]